MHAHTVTLLRMKPLPHSAEQRPVATDCQRYCGDSVMDTVAVTSFVRPATSANDPRTTTRMRIETEVAVDRAFRPYP
jgi:hypothetical protein